jgi:hypothetical protein
LDWALKQALERPKPVLVKSVKPVKPVNRPVKDAVKEREYMREYMRKRRAAARAQQGEPGDKASPGPGG